MFSMGSPSPKLFLTARTHTCFTLVLPTSIVLKAYENLLYCIWPISEYAYGKSTCDELLMSSYIPFVLMTYVSTYFCTSSSRQNTTWWFIMLMSTTMCVVFTVEVNGGVAYCKTQWLHSHVLHFNVCSNLCIHASPLINTYRNMFLIFSLVFSL